MNGVLIAATDETLKNPNINREHVFGDLQHNCIFILHWRQDAATRMRYEETGKDIVVAHSRYYPELSV